MWSSQRNSPEEIRGGEQVLLQQDDLGGAGEAGEGAGEGVTVVVGDARSHRHTSSFVFLVGDLTRAQKEEGVRDESVQWNLGRISSQHPFKREKRK